MAANIETLVSDVENAEQVNNQPEVTNPVDAHPKEALEAALEQLRSMNEFVRQSSRSQGSISPSQNRSQVENKQEFESKISKESTVEKKLDLEKRTKVETIGDLPKNIQEFLLDIDANNTALVAGGHPAHTNIYRFLQTDSVNHRVHGLTPLMVMIVFNRIDLAEEFIKFEGIDLALPAIQTGIISLDGRTILSILLQRQGIVEGFVLGRSTRERQEREFLFIEQIIRLCPALMHYQSEDNDIAGLSQISLVSSARRNTQNALRCLKLFRQYGANMDLANSDGSTPFSSAVENLISNTICEDSRLQIFSYLVSCGVNIQIGDPELKGNLLHQCVYYRLSSKIAAYLLTLGVQYDVLNSDNKTAFELTQIPVEQYPERIRDELEDAVEGLVSVMQQNLSTSRAMLQHIDQFYIAVRKSDIKTICEYIATNLPLNVRNRRGRTPLHEWCYANFTQSNGTTLTDQEATKAANKIAKLFFSKGASLTLLDDTNHTPLDAAVESNNSIIQTALMKIIQTIINRKILDLWTENPAAIKILQDVLKSAVPDVNFYQISSYRFGFIYKFAQNKGLPLMLEGIQLALQSPEIKAEAQRILQARAQASNGAGSVNTLVVYGAKDASLNLAQPSEGQVKKPRNGQV